MSAEVGILIDLGSSPQPNLVMDSNESTMSNLSTNQLLDLDPYAAGIYPIATGPNLQMLCRTVR